MGWIVLIMIAAAVYTWVCINYKQYIQMEDPTFWEREISRNEKRYQGDFPQNRVLFYGNSSIRFWRGIEDDLAPNPVLDHGFGGSKIKDAVYFLIGWCPPFLHGQ